MDERELLSARGLFIFPTLKAFTLSRFSGWFGFFPQRNQFWQAVCVLRFVI
jgi:hypothetical protein